METLLQHVSGFMKQALPAAKGELGVVGVSGGPDSVALACLLTALQARGELGPLILAHINHCLRGEESDEDEAFVRELADRLSDRGHRVEFQSTRVEIRREAKEHGLNLEAAARQERYRWLAHVANSRGGFWVATGHTADDQAETVLHRLLRGTGLHGLQGIAGMRQLAPGVQLIRPLLAVVRTEVLALLRAERQSFRVDSSNADVDFTRNRIRRELLPELAAKFNPAIVSLLCRLSCQAREVQSIVEGVAGRLLHEAELPRAGGLVILRQAPLADVSAHLVREMFRFLWEREHWPAMEMTFNHWDRLAGVARGEEQAIDLPGGIRARRCGHVIQLGKEGLAPKPLSHCGTDE